MVIWDSQQECLPPLPNREQFFAGRFAALAAAVLEPAELGFHLCYGDWEGKHLIEPEDAGRIASIRPTTGPH